MTEDPRCKQLRSCYSGVVNDVMRAKGLTNYVIPNRIRPLQPEKTLAGPVWTITGNYDDNLDEHTTLLEWTGLLSQAPAGFIWTAQPNTHAIAQMGELSAETLHAKGVLGCVIDGALRDTNFILDLNFPCWGTHHTPADVVGCWVPKEVEVEISFDDVKIKNGDWLIGDRDGMIRIPQEIIDEVVSEAVEMMNVESKVRSAIREGIDPQEAYLKYRKF